VVVFFTEEVWLSVVSALHDVARYSIQVAPGTAGHGQTIAEKPSLIIP
jgi:hypothetical protein